MRLRLAIAFVVFGSAGCASLNAGRAMPASGPDHLAGWNTVPVRSLDAVWERAQSTGGVIAVEPETQVAGTQAAWKKTWEAADSFLKLYWGDEPIWFPSDMLRRTVCSKRVRWSYFWHFASGDERDLHPWFASGFDHLVGPTLAKALAGSGAVDVSSCADVGGAETPCLYGEVTPPMSFDRWFCGGIKGACKDRLKTRPHDVNKEFTDGESVCVSGPWVHERVHGGRPEIHPAEVLWSRRSPRGDWRFAVVPDHSGRFEKGGLYRSLLKGGAKPTAGWSGDRPVELWVAFEHDARVPTEFDVATRCLKDGGERTTPAPPIALPAPGGDFTPVPPPMPGMTMAARTWVKAASVRGLFVVRTDSRVEGCAAVVMALSGRPKADPPAALALAPVAAPTAAAVARIPAEAAAPALRLRAVDDVSARRRSLRGLEEFSVETRAGFAGGTPTEEDDQGVADGLNADLRRKAHEREAIFGTDKPFLIQWEIEARRRSDNSVVAVRVGIAPQPGDQHVTVRTFRSDLTREIRVNAGEAQARPALAKAGLKRAGDILVSVPHGVTVRGRGNVQFMGSKPKVLVGATAGIGFSSPTTDDEWELLGEILQWIPGDASTRLPKLQALACHPLPGPCSLSDLATHAQRQIQDPATRFEALHAFEDPQRTFARFLRHLAVGYLFNGSADSAEVQSLKTLLESACLKPAPAAPPAASFCE